jgi:hypothetical protein
MPVNREVKGMLAKCLSQENLIVEYRNVPTASFDVERRLLVLPNWEKASDTVFTMLTQHESAHAIFSPSGEDFDYRKKYPEVPHDVINVLEDVRVEKLLKRKYPGSAKHFFNGYNELNSDDFFSTKEENLDELTFIDRINLYYKIGAFHNIAFSDEENEFLTRAIQTETFDEVLKLAREIVDFVQYKRQKVDSMPTAGGSDEMSGSGGEEVETPGSSSEDGENQDGQNKSELEQDSQGQSQTEGESFGDDMNKSMEAPNGGGFGQEASNQHGETNKDELTSKTSRSFDEKSQDLVDKYAQETHYVELPKMNLDTMIIPNEFIHRKAKEFYETRGSYYKETFDFACKEYNTYKKSAEKEVSYLVKEFECKKSADQYARSSTARTGVLDTSKLHTYKFNEDLFKKVSVVPDGKNHGLIFILDWSGSMSEFILDAYKQLLNLIWFCRKVNIPFEVYAFTLDAHSYMELQPNHPPVYEKVAGVLAPENSFRLMNFFTSKVNNRVLDEQLKNIWCACYSYQKRAGAVPPHLDLSGSPIGESMMALHSLIPDFQAKNKLQKVNVIFLTDGEGYQNSVTVARKGRYPDSPEYIGNTKHSRTAIRDRKTGRVYPALDYDNFPRYAKILLQTVKDRFPTVNLINFRITPGRDFATCYRWYGSGQKNYEKVKADYRKNSCVQFTGTGFDQFNVIASSSLAQDEDFVVPENATKAQIKSSFSKMLGKKKTNKKLLGSFISLVA